jgi:predicted RNA binding protein YcfA (HicA-like mRNA interferase family)
MEVLSNISGQNAVKIFCRLGYKLDHQTGSHMILWHENRSILSIPNHRELAPGLDRGLIRKAGITMDEFIELKKEI